MAQTNPVKVFPRGYSGGQAPAGPTHKPRDGDTRITQLYADYTSPNHQSGAWSFRREVIKAAVRLLSGRPNWFLQQDHNPLVQDYNYQFVTDTLRFISTGQRHIGIHSWPALLSHHPDDGHQDVSERTEIAKWFEVGGVPSSITALIQAWCRQPGGFDDMVCTLYLLFGSLDIKVTQPEETV